MNEHPQADCLCVDCGRWFHHQGIMRHRAWHRDRGERVTIEYSSGKTLTHDFRPASEKGGEA